MLLIVDGKITGVLLTKEGYISAMLNGEQMSEDSAVVEGGTHPLGLVVTL